VCLGAELLRSGTGGQLELASSTLLDDPLFVFPRCVAGELAI
jgi:hypothetical protein